MPSRKEIQWSQLRVGALVLVAVGVLITLIFLMSGATGGLFARKLVLRCYFENAQGLKNGAPVALEGVTIGNVSRIRVVPARNPKPVEVTMQVNHREASALHTDSMCSIAQAGALGDSYIDISSTHATGPPPGNDAELRVIESPSIGALLRTADTGMLQVTALVQKVQVMMDSLNSRKGTVGELINNPDLYQKLERVAGNLETITNGMSAGKGSLGKLMTDDTLYQHASSAVEKLDNLVAALDRGEGTAGKLLKDDTLYKNLNSAVVNTNQLVSDLNAGKGALGKFTKDPEFARKLDDTVTNLDTLLSGINEGKGTMGQLMQNRSLYDHSDQTMDQAQQLVKSIRENPKKYLVIHLKLF